MGHAERSRLAFRLRSVFQGCFTVPARRASREHLVLTLPVGPLKVVCLSADKTPFRSAREAACRLPSIPPTAPESSTHSPPTAFNTTQLST